MPAILDEPVELFNHSPFMYMRDSEELILRLNHGALPAVSLTISSGSRPKMLREILVSILAGREVPAELIVVVTQLISELKENMPESNSSSYVLQRALIELSPREEERTWALATAGGQ